MPVQGGAADNKVLWIVLGVVAAIALIVIIAVAMSGGDDESGGGSGGGGSGGGGSAGYTAANEQEFMDTCVPGGGEAACGCAWTEITETISYERFVEMESELVELGPNPAPEDIPQELVTIMAGCAGAS